jgi:hypothetical protein
MRYIIIKMIDKIYDMEVNDQGGQSWQSSTSALTDLDMSLKSNEVPDFMKDGGKVHTIQQLLERSKCAEPRQI